MPVVTICYHFFFRPKITKHLGEFLTGFPPVIPHPVDVSVKETDLTIYLQNAFKSAWLKNFNFRILYCMCFLPLPYFSWLDSYILCKGFVCVKVKEQILFERARNFCFVFGPLFILTNNAISYAVCLS